MDEHSSLVEKWVEGGPKAQRQFRESVHIILSAITRDPLLVDLMVMKGGILMALRYGSPRFTRDIDFSTGRLLNQIDPEAVHAALKSSLALASAEFEYGLDCKVQSFQIQPSKRPEASFPSLMISIGSAYRGSSDHRHLMRGAATSKVAIDFSLNEQILSIETLKIQDGDRLQTYGITDLVAEKYRSLLQQPSRDRYRRQDIFDLNQLTKRNFNEAEKISILESLRAKSRSRNLEPSTNSLSDPEVIRRAQKDYHHLTDEIEGELPDFEESFDRVNAFYCSLPWNLDTNPLD